MDETEDHFSLKWNDFRSSFTEGFHNFLLEEMMVDVTLAAEGKFVQAHKLVLSVCSPYFKNLFKINPCKHPIVILKDVGYSELSCMLQYMYKGEVGVKHELLPSFLKLADTLKVKGLAEEITQNQKFESVKETELTLGKIRKKKNKNLSNDCGKENTESEVEEKQKEKRNPRGKKRKLNSKSETTNKIKKEKVEQELSVNSDEDDDNPLVKLISDKVKNGESSKCSESICDIKNNYSGCDEEINTEDNNDDNEDDEEEEDEEGNVDDFSISTNFFPPDTIETEQTPQDIPVYSPVLRTSPVWNYYDKIQNNIAICKICRKILKGAQTTQAEYHLRAKHPEEAAVYFKVKAEWIEKKKKVNEIFYPMDLA